MNNPEEEAILSSLKAVFSENQFDSSRTRKLMTGSFASNCPETSQFDPGNQVVAKLDQKDSPIERPNSLVNLKPPQSLFIPSIEKKLNPCSSNFFVNLETPGSDSKLQKKPIKKTLRVSEADSQSYILDPQKVVWK